MSLHVHNRLVRVAARRDALDDAEKAVAVRRERLHDAIREAVAHGASRRELVDVGGVLPEEVDEALRGAPLPANRRGNLWLLGGDG